MTAPSVLLAIESSCDDTAAAVLVDGGLRSNVIASQGVHAQYGGVVPELASRDHQRLIVPVVNQALHEAGVAKADLEAVAVTYGPGLAGSLLVGLSFAKAMAFGLGIPLVGVNHLEGHLYSVFIEPPFPPFPFLCLVVSGGHTQLMMVDKAFEHRLIGRTRDDAAGEAFDKVGKLLGLGYPAGPVIDRLAHTGDPTFQRFPRSRPGRTDYSFSGLKTNVLYYLNRFNEAERAQLLDEHLPDIAASVQQAIVDVLIASIEDAVRETGVRHVAIVGGVSANSGLRNAAQASAKRVGYDVYTPALAYCMDNAAMIATAGWRKLKAGHVSPLTLTAVPSLTL
ncbi:MAG: tRNA (adenosine(37)-N6)-threonylcarbamoyltransferase complex transferase subunit TsaD [Rhodothermales bacterium]